MSTEVSQSLSIAIMVQRALNLVDERLVDHGLRVALSVDAMLERSGNLCADD